MSHVLPLSGIASGTAALWIAGAHVRARLYQARVFRRRRLRSRVISIGNLSWGGAGKTPLTIWLAARLQAAGLDVSILTRGYGRTSRERVKVLPPGLAAAEVRRDGDEVQLYLRHLRAPIGISSSRYDAGSVLERTFPVDVHLLDDGFQHLALERDLDLVLVDASNPWGARPGWPVLLREGFSSLRRAHAVLLTRCELVEKIVVDKLTQTLHGFNPQARCFTVRTKLERFAVWPAETPVAIEEIAARRPLAFCALGNPQNFFGMLTRAGIGPAAKISFADHHKYNARDAGLLSRLAQENRADCFVTTEKDVVNLPLTPPLPLPVYWAAIEPVVENEEKLTDWIQQRMHLGSLKV